MPPQACDLWPGPVGRAFAEMDGCQKRGDLAGVVRGCDQVLAILQGHEAEFPDRPTAKKVARAYFDVSLYCRKVDRLADARRALERSRRYWEVLLAGEPNDFYGRSLLAACHNHLGLIADAAGEGECAESEYLAALAARIEVYERHPGHEDEYDNLVYLAGVRCNLGNLYRRWGEGELADQYYDDAIFILSCADAAGSRA